MSTALTVRQPTSADWGMIQEIATAARDSAALGAMKQQGHAIKLLTAWENGLPLTSAFSVVHIINNIPSLSPKAVWAKIIIHSDFKSYQEKRLEKSGKFHGYEITLERSNGVKATRTFTLDNAKSAKLDQKDNWQMYEEPMCYWRAMGFAQDVVFPDVTVGVVRADALGAMVTMDGDVIEGSWSAVDNKQIQPAKPQPGDLLTELVHTYGAEAVMRVNDGKIPSTLEEMEKARDRLANPVFGIYDVETIKF
jgi:hypothetical protein